MSDFPSKAGQLIFEVETHQTVDELHVNVLFPLLSDDSIGADSLMKSWLLPHLRAESSISKRPDSKVLLGLMNYFSS